MRFTRLLSSILILLFVSILLSLSCKKDKTERVPSVPVNISIPPNSVQFNSLNTIGGWVYVTGGYKGIIVYRKDSETFMSFDRACPFHPTEECSRLKVEASGLIAVDSCCGSRFFLTDGSVLKGPSTLPLKSYYTTFDGNYIYITN